MARSAQAQAALDRKKEYAEQIASAKLAGDLVRYAAKENGTWGKSNDTAAQAARATVGKQTAQSLVDQAVTSLTQKKNKETVEKTQKAKADKIVLEHTPESDTPQEQLKNHENKEIDWTDANARKQYEERRKELQEQVDSAGAQLAQEEDRQAISDMPEEDREKLERYAVSQVENQNKPVELSDPNSTLFLGLFGNQPNAVTGEDFTDLFGTYGKKRTDEMAETYMRDTNAELNQKVAEAGRSLANAGRDIDPSLLPDVSPYDVDVKPVTQASNDFVAGTLASLASIPVSAVSGAVGTVGQLQSAARSTGRYPTTDPNATGTALQTFSGAIRGQVGENLTGDVYDEDGNLVKDGGLIGDTLNLLYQGGMSMADSIARAYLFGSAGGKTLAGLNSFSQTMAESAEKGATPAQAALMATAAAFIEAATEKYSLENLIATAKGKNALSTIKNIVRQAGIEISEEEASLVGTLLAEAAILGDKSDFNQTVSQLKEAGFSEEEAKKQAWQNIWDEAIETAIVSGISGTAGGAISSLKGQYADPGEDYSKGIPATPESSLESQPWDSLYQTSPEAQTETDSQIQQNRADAILDGVVPKNQEPVQAESTTKADDVVNKTLEDIGLKKKQRDSQQKETYEALAAAKRVAKNLQKDISKTGANIEKGKGSPARLAQLQSELERQNKLVADLESQYAYFTEDYEKNITAAIVYQQMLFDDMKQKAAQAIADNEAGKITDAQLKVANEAYMTAGDTLRRLKNMTQDEYRAYLAESGLVADVDYGAIERDRKPQKLSQDSADRIADILNNGDYAVSQKLKNAEVRTKNGKWLTPDTSTGDATVNTETTAQPNAAPSGQSPQTSAPQVDTQRTYTEGGQTVPGDVDTSTLGKQSAPSGDYRDSNSFTNSGLKSADEDVRNAYQDTMQRNPSAAKSEVKHNDDVDAVARERTSTPEKVWAEADYLIQKTENGMAWDAEDVPTASRAIAELFRDGSAEAIAKRTELQEAFKKNDTKVGQVVQAHKIIGTMKDIESPMTAADTFTERMYDMKEKDTTYNPQKSGGKDFETWRKEVVTNVAKIAADIDKVPDGDTAAMKAIIEDIAYQSGISQKNGQYGLSRGMKKTLSKVSFDDLKMLANSQVASMADVYRKRSAAELTESARKSAMLSAITTFERNLTGNTAIGLLDSASDSTSARIADGILSKFTNKQTVGNDIKNIKQYVQGAIDAARWASICVELNVPVETDAMSTLETATNGGQGGKYVGKTFTPNGNIVMRGLYAYQKFQSYELDVSDKVFEGGTKSAVSESLKNLKGLSADEQQRLADYTANRRTFKDATWTDESGDTHGAVASRFGQWAKNGLIGLGEKGGKIVGGVFGEKGKEVGGNVGKAATSAVVNKVAPFVSVPTNVAQVGVDYSVGIVKGAAEMAAIIHDAKKGIDIPVERQRQAASDFGRGVSGLGLIGIAAAATKAGIIAVHNDDDYDKKSLEQSQGLSGAQINLSALGRLGEDGGEKWRSGDILISLDFLEPFNTHLYLGAELAQYDDMWETIKNYPGSVFNASIQAFMDSPMVSGLQELMDDVNDLKEGNMSAGDFAAENLGEYVSSFEPQIVRQAAQSIDGYYRDTRGETASETAFNQLIAGIPFLSKTLPKKVDGLGNEQKRPGWLSTFLDPTKITTYNENEVATYLSELSDSTGDKGIYPDRQAPKAIKIGGEEIILSGSQREIYQKAYGGAVNEMYSALMNLQGFKDLPGDVQSAALKKAETYATEIAKASIANNPDAPEKTAEELANSIYVDTVKNTINNAFKDIKDDAKYGRDNTANIAALEQAYSNVSLLPDEMKEEIMEDSGGRLGAYATAKKNGVSTETFLNVYDQYETIRDNEDLTTSEKAQDWSVALDKAERDGTLTATQKKALKEKMVFRYSMQAETAKYDEMRESGISIEKADQIIDILDKVVGTGKVDKETGKASVRAIDKYAAIANVIDLTDDEIDAIMEDYMPDYDPEDDSPDKTYLRYEYVRQQLGLSPEQFVDIYNVKLDGGKKYEVIANWINLGYDSNEANILYRLFNATGKTKIDVESWYAEQVGQRGSTISTSTSSTTAKSYPGETIQQGSLDDFEQSLIERLYGITK